ncbi:trem-like transcript 1 protein isoform 2-T2 [Trichechus inunguis]
MGPNLLLLLLLTLAGQGSVGSLPEVLQVPVGGSILVQCHYRLQDVKARKVWCRFLLEGCQPLVSSAVDRRAPEGTRMFLTDLGGGLLQVEMLTLREEDAGEYGCVVEGAAGPQTLHRIALEMLPPAPSLKEEEVEKTSKTGVLVDKHFSDPVGSASPLEPSWDEKRAPGKQALQDSGLSQLSLRILLILGVVLLLGLLVVAVVLFAVMAKRKGNCQESKPDSGEDMEPEISLLMSDGSWLKAENTRKMFTCVLLAMQRHSIVWIITNY